MQRLASLSKRQQLVILAAVAILVLLLLSLVDWRTLRILLQRTDWNRLLLATPFLLASYLLLVTGWRYLLPVQPPWWRTFSVTSVSFALSCLTPLPDSALRIITTEQGTTASVTQVTAALVMERLLAIIMRLLAFIALLSLWTWQRSNSTLVTFVRLGLIVAAVAALIWIVRHPQSAVAASVRFRRLPYIRNLHVNLHVEETVTSLTNSLSQTFSVRRFLTTLILFLLIWLAAGTYHLLALTALPIRLASESMIAIALALLIVLPPTIPTMIVLYQTIAAALLVTLLLLNTDQATAYAIIVQLPQAILWLLLGILSYRRSNLRVHTLVEQVRALLNTESSSQANQA
jgi:uncharacterized membrane protein YbhN (UPF0104 family)